LALPATAASRIDAEIEATWPALDLQHLGAAVGLELTPSADRARPGALPLAGRLTAELRDGRDAEVTISELRTAGARLSGHLSLAERERLGGDLRLAGEDVATLVAAAEGFLDR